MDQTPALPLPWWASLHLKYFHSGFSVCDLGTFPSYFGMLCELLFFSGSSFLGVQMQAESSLWGEKKNRPVQTVTGCVYSRKLFNLSGVQVPS